MPKAGVQDLRGATGWAPTDLQLAVLALLDRQPTYGYDLAHRLDERFPGLFVTTTSNVYAAVNRLKQRGLIEPAATGPSDTSQGGQPRVRYRPTAAGVALLREVLAQQLRGDLAKDELLRRLLTLGVRDFDDLDRMIDEYERLCLEDAGTLRPARSDAALAARPHPRDVLEALIEADRRLQVQARLDWVTHARAEVARLRLRES